MKLTPQEFDKLQRIRKRQRLEKKEQKAKEKRERRKYAKKRREKNHERKTGKKWGQNKSFGEILYHNRTDAEKKLSEALTREGIIFEEQHPISCYGVTYWVDFYIENVFGEKFAIELDGYHHRLKEKREDDKRRSSVMYKARGIKTKRFWNPKSNVALDRIVDEICRLNPKIVDFNVNPSWPIIP